MAEIQSHTVSEGAQTPVGGRFASRKLVAFLVLTAVLSSVAYALMLSAGAYDAAGGQYVFLLMWSPGLAAILVQLATERRIRGLGWRLPNWRYLLAAYLIPLAYTAVAYIVLWMTGLGTFSLEPAVAAATARTGITPQNPTLFAVIYLLVASTLGLFGGLVTGLGEEIGWRGLLVPELARRLSFTQTSLVSGGIWAVWHVPAMFIGYSGGTPVWYSFIWFAILVVGSSFLYAWLRLRSNSLWPAVVLHASHNLFVQLIFDGMTVPTATTPYFSGEFGVLVPAAAVVAVWLVLRRRRGPVLEVSTMPAA